MATGLTTCFLLTAQPPVKARAHERPASENVRAKFRKFLRTKGKETNLATEAKCVNATRTREMGQFEFWLLVSQKRKFNLTHYQRPVDLFPRQQMKESQHMIAEKYIDAADRTFADENAKKKFPEIDFENSADVADQIRGSEGEETPADDDRQFIVLQD